MKSLWARTLVVSLFCGVGLFGSTYGPVYASEGAKAAAVQPRPTSDAAQAKAQPKAQPKAPTSQALKPSVRAPAPRAPESATAIDLASLQKKLRATMTKQKVPGVGFALVSKDKVLWAGGFGFADIAKKRPVTADTIFRVGSISKSFVAMGFLKLVEQGKVKLQDPIRPLLGKVKVTNAWAKTDPIRLVHLLEHTAGFDDMHFVEFYNTKHKPEIGLEAMLAINPNSRRARWRPGTYVSYSNPGYGLAGYLMERLTKQRFEDYLRKEILRPLGMKEASFRKTKAVSEKLAQGYAGRDWKISPYYHIYHRPAGSLHASPKEMALFVQALLRRGETAEGQRLLKASSIQRMETPKSALHVRKGLKHGYGLANYSSFKRGFHTFGHNGGIDGFLSTARYNPKHGIGYVLLVNQSGNRKGLRALEKVILKTLAPGRKTPVAKAIKLADWTLAQIAGTYQPVHGRNQLFSFLNAFSWMRIVKEQGKLFQQNYGFFSWSKKRPMVPVKGGPFRLGRSPVGNVRSVLHKDQYLLFVGKQAFQKRGAWRPYLYSMLFSLALLAMLGTLLFALVWVPRRWLLKTKFPFIWARAVPLLTVMAFIGMIMSIAGQPYQAMTVMSGPTVAFYLCSLLFGALASIGVFTAYRSLRVPDMNGVARGFLLFVSVAHFGFVLFLWPLIGLRFWAGW